MATASAPPPKTNRIGLTVLDYRGGKTTLCAGCGHNAISERIIDSMYEMGVEPERVVTDHDSIPEAPKLSTADMEVKAAYPDSPGVVSAEASAKAKRELGWRTSPHEDCLEETIAWYRDHDGERLSSPGSRQPFALRVAGAVARRSPLGWR